MYGQDKSKWQSVQKIGIANVRDGKNNHIRSHLFVDFIDHSRFPAEALAANCGWLRALDLSRSRMESLPSSVVLPKSITKLCNLQTLKILLYYKLKELPRDLSRFVKLRVLDIERCIGLTYMPRDMVRNISSFEKHEESSDGTIITVMEELQPPSNLRHLKMERYNGVKIPTGWKTTTSLPHLVRLELLFCELEYFPLFPSLKVLDLKYMPKLKRLGAEESSSNPQLQQLLPRLSRLFIHECPELQCNLQCPSLEFLHLTYFN
ncbi:putative disease resistance RPP13-like protein 1 [Bienertia sinuspersici]